MVIIAMVTLETVMIIRRNLGVSTTEISILYTLYIAAHQALSVKKTIPNDSCF